MNANNLNKELERIVQKHMDIPTLETRRMDSLDFHDVAVWTLKDALMAAYKLGQQNPLAK